MAQVTIYINSSLEAKIKETAKSLNISISKFISGILEKQIQNEWDPSTKELAGSWSNFPDIETIRSVDAKDTSREAF